MITQNLAYTYLESPVGRILIAGDDAALHYISFPGGHKAMQPDPSWQQSSSPFQTALTQLSDYFDGQRQQFTLPFTLNGTPFQESVWQLLADIPFGKTQTYGWMAQMLGHDVKSARAVGLANGSNPLPILLPCHRIIGANGALTGFGGGLDTKEWLLKHEGVLQDQPKLL